MWTARLPFRSLKLRLLGLAVIAIAVALGTAGVVLTVIFQMQIERRVVQELQQRSLELVSALENGAAGHVTMARVLADPRYNRPYGGAYWQVEQQGSPPLRSRSLWDATMSLALPSSSGGALQRLTGPNGEALDVWVRPITMRLGERDEPVLTGVALARAEVDALGQSFATDTAVALAVLGVALSLGAWLQGGVGLRPLGTLRERLATVHRGQAGHLTGLFPDEVEPLVRDLNRLFDQQRELVIRARTAAGDLAHALKTPLTLIEGEALRLDQRGHSSSAALLREQVAGMRRHVDRVLARARIHGLAIAGQPSADLAQVVDRLFAVMRRLPRGDTIEWINAVPTGAPIAMEGDDLAELLGTLLDNARKWTGSTVRVTASASQSRVSVAIEDNGPGLPPAYSEQITRGQSGSDVIEGTGLGLGIAADLLAAYGTQLRIETNVGGGCRAAFEVCTR